MRLLNWHVEIVEQAMSDDVPITPTVELRQRIN
jgi:hypothetical protein